ncbi:hypothetical protein D1007_12080 [Hordeum vulgare]|nr:hypothetical protein D1007_12080 [Hordeum vulgare]
MYGYDSDDDGSVEELDEMDALHKKMNFSRRLQGRKEVGDPKPKDEDENAHLKKCIKFGCLQEFKIWLSDYAIRNHRTFAIDHSDQNLRYTVKCDNEGMASSGSIPRPSCTDGEDMLNKWKEATLDKKKDKDFKTPPCWCGERLFEESLQHAEYEDHLEKEKKERKKHEAKRAHKEKEAHDEERAIKLGMARQAYEEDMAHYNKGKGIIFP